MTITFPYKDPNEYLDYTLDWTARVTTDDAITSSTWMTPTSGGLTIASTSNASWTTTVWLSNGTIGITYQLTNRISTVFGRVMDQTCKIKIKSR